MDLNAQGRIARRRCSVCGVRGHDRRRCSKAVVVPRSSRRAFDPWLDLEFLEHPEAIEIVNSHPDGMTLEQVGHVLGVTRERIRQIEVIALRKLRSGIGLAELVEIDGVWFPVIECERCEELFPRRGRARICPECVTRPRLPCPPRALSPPRSVVVPAAAAARTLDTPPPPALEEPPRPPSEPVVEFPNLVILFQV